MRVWGKAQLRCDAPRSESLGGGGVLQFHLLGRLCPWHEGFGNEPVIRRLSAQWTPITPRPPQREGSGINQ